MPRASALIALSLLAGCGGEAANDRVVRLDWSNGDEFHVATRYRVMGEMTEEIADPLSLDAEPEFGDHWSEETVWSYQVVETGFTPDANDDLYEFAVDGDAVTPISVVRAWVDASMNDGSEILEADPVIYLVFREENDRLLALVQFVNVDGDRVETSWKDTDTTRSWSPLAQSMITGLPTYLAPAGARWETDERKLENGGTLSTEKIDGATVDVFFDDEIGGGLVATRYEEGAPWPTWTVTDSVEARLLTADEVSRRRAERPWALPDVPENFDYRAAIRSSVDINGALKLDEDTMDGGWSATVADGYYPWAGSWWPQSAGDLVFGYSARQTFSDRLKTDIDPIKRELDGLNEELRKLDRGSSEYSTKVEAYKAKQKTLVDKMVAFYDKLLQDLDGGKIKVQSGTISHSTDGWSYQLDELSPMDKYALAMWAKGNKYPNPFYIAAWELLNHYSPAGGSWWGHCNGWSAAAILTNEPRETVYVDIKGNRVGFTSADIKGLMTESHYSTYSSFYGARYNEEGDDIQDLTPKAFHIIVNHYIRQRRVPFVFDITADGPVWNYPAYAVDLTVTETTAGSAPSGKLNLNTADRNALDALPAIGLATADKIIKHRATYGAFQTVEDLKKVQGLTAAMFDKVKDLVAVEISTDQRTFEVEAFVKMADDGVGETHLDSSPSTPVSLDRTWKYTLVTDKAGNVVSGTWDNEREHPDFAWIPYENPMAGGSGNSENNHLNYQNLLDLIGKQFRR